MSAASDAKCLGCGHSRVRHIKGEGMCLVDSCRLCLIYRPRPIMAKDNKRHWSGRELSPTELHDENSRAYS